MTSDHIPVVHHNTSFTVDGTTYVISDNTYADLVAVKPDLAKLEDLLLLCKANNICSEIDMKHQDPTACNAVYGVVKKTGMRGKAIFTCTATTARNLIAVDTNIVVSVSGCTTTTIIAGLSDIAESALLCICSTEDEYITDDIIEAAHNIGALSKVWTLNTTSAVESFIGAGGDLVITDSVLPAS